MADVTKEIQITEAWTEITGPLGLADGQTYQIEVHSSSVPIIGRGVTYPSVNWANTDDDNEPAVLGHSIVINDGHTLVDTRRFTKDAGVRTWMRTTKGTAVVSATPA